LAPAIQIVDSREYPLGKKDHSQVLLQDGEKADRATGGEIQGEDPIKIMVFP